MAPTRGAHQYPVDECSTVGVSEGHRHISDAAQRSPTAVMHLHPRIRLNASTISSSRLRRLIRQQGEIVLLLDGEMQTEQLVESVQARQEVLDMIRGDRARARRLQDVPM